MSEERPVDPMPFPKPPSANTAVQRCYDAWMASYQSERACGKSDWSARNSAQEAFRVSMPDLTSLTDVQDFVACIAQGLLIGAIEPRDSSKLLYAAQVALSAYRNAPQPPKTPAS